MINIELELRNLRNDSLWRLQTRPVIVLNDFLELGQADYQVAFVHLLA